MNTNPIQTIKNSIHKTFHSKKQKDTWLLSNNVKLRNPQPNDFAFCLENTVNKRDPFGCFEDKPPKGIRKMCDMIITLYHKDSLHVFIIEQKSKTLGQYEAQLSNGKYFCDWFFTLLNKHEHYQNNPNFIGLLIREPRKYQNKTPTNHRTKQESKTHPLFKKFYDIRNETMIHLQNYC